MRIKKIQPWPWYVQCRQYDGHTGKLSRPRIVDALGKPVSLNNIRQATLAAMAPVLIDRLDRLWQKAELLHLQIQSELGFNLPMPAELTLAKEVLDIAGRA